MVSKCGDLLFLFIINQKTGGLPSGGWLKYIFMRLLGFLLKLKEAFAFIHLIRFFYDKGIYE